MAERIPISLLLGGQAPEAIRPAEPGLSPLPPGPEGPPGGPETESVLRELVLALLSIPEIRLLVQEELLRRQQSGPRFPRPKAEAPIGEPGASDLAERSPGPRRSFAEKLAELRARR